MIEVDHRRRTYYLHVPANLPADKPAPLVLVFHGGGGTALGTERYLTHFSDLADQEDFLVAYPEGINQSWNDGRGTPSTAAANEKVDDLAFALAMIDEICQQHSVDPRRIYATGISNGAIFSHYLAANHAEKIAAIAPVVGGMLQMWIGYRKAFEMLCTGWNLSSQELYRLGAINKVVPDDRIEAEAMRYAEIMSLMPLENLKLSKQSLKFGMNLMGAREQIWHNQETNTLSHCAASEREKEFFTIMKEKGMAEALDFRDKPFEKYGFKRNKATDI